VPGGPGEGGRRRRRRRRGGHRPDGRPVEGRDDHSQQGDAAAQVEGAPGESQPRREPQTGREQGPRPDRAQGEQPRGERRRRRRHGRGQGAPGGGPRPDEQGARGPEGQGAPQGPGGGRPPRPPQGPGRGPGPRPQGHPARPAPGSRPGPAPEGRPAAGRQENAGGTPAGILGIDRASLSEIDSGWDIPLDAEPRDEVESGELAAAVRLAEEPDGDAAPLTFLASPPVVRDPDGEDVFADLDEAPPPSGQLWNTVGVKFRDAGRAHEFDSGELMLERGDRVVVETDRGLSIGLVAVPSGRRVTNEPLRRVIRRADANDLRQEQRNQRREADALKFAGERARERKLPMKLFRVEYIHGGSKATFFFSSEGRVDFRDLVRDLTHRLHTRVELRQVGVRDESKIVGGIGTCGRELCCSTWLPRFEPVSIRMAKDQNMVLNPQKVSGVCGRLKCCLAYEEATYRELRKGMPKPGKRVTTPKGEGRVQEVDILGGRVKVWFEGGPPQTFAASEVQPILPPGAAPRAAADDLEPPEPEVEAEAEAEMPLAEAEPDGSADPAAAPGGDGGGDLPGPD
jgi:cell fate regulator YaaT (PSP1 superfamily)